MPGHVVRVDRSVRPVRQVGQSSRKAADPASPHCFNLYRFDGDATFDSRDVERDFLHAFANREYRGMLFQLFRRHIVQGAAFA